MGRALVGGIVGLLLGLVAGCAGGFFLGVWSTDAGKSAIEDLASSEEPADIGKTNSISRAAFELDYPGNWKIDSVDDDYDPDHLFTIESPGSCYVQFLVLETASSPDDSIAAQKAAFVPAILKEPEETAIATWGSYHGSGVLLEGKIWAGFQGSVRMFAHSAHDKSFTVVEMCFDEDIASVEPGFELVRKSFRLKRSA